MNQPQSHTHNRCHSCGDCQTIAGGWLACEKSQCDEALPLGAVRYWETARATVKRIGRSPLSLCQFVGNC